MPKIVTVPTRLFKVRGSNLESFFAAHSPIMNDKLTLTGIEHSIPLWLQKDTVITESGWWQVFTSDRNAHMKIHPTEVIMQWHWMMPPSSGVKYLKNKKGVVEYTIAPRPLFVAHFQSIDSRQDEVVSYNAPIAASGPGTSMYAESVKYLTERGYTILSDAQRRHLRAINFESGFLAGVENEKNRVRLEREQEDYEDSPASFDHGTIEQAEVNVDSADSDVHSKEAEDFYRESTGFLKRFRPDLLAALSSRNEDENKDAESKDSEGELAMLFGELQRKVARLIIKSK